MAKHLSNPQRQKLRKRYDRENRKLNYYYDVVRLANPGKSESELDYLFLEYLRKMKLRVRKIEEESESKRRETARRKNSRRRSKSVSCRATGRSIRAFQGGRVSSR